MNLIWIEQTNYANWIVGTLRCTDCGYAIDFTGTDLANVRGKWSLLIKQFHCTCEARREPTGNIDLWQMI